MNVLLIVVLVIFAIIAFVATLALVGVPIFGDSGQAGAKKNLRAMVNSQRNFTASAAMSGVAADAARRRDGKLYESADEAKVKRVSSSRLTLKKKLKYAQWKLPQLAYRACEVAISLFTAGLLSINFNIVVVVCSLSAGPLFMGWLLNMAVERRFKAFDADYPQFLLSLVGLLKTGMNAMAALEAAAQGLEEGSLVKSEVELMMERLRFGVSEDKSIGSFGEDIHHPEIELFVQALLLSRRVGGTLSDTLERLAKQVRKRQFFRMAANAAVGMQRGSIWFIIAILCSLEVYLYYFYPETITDAWADETGWNVWQVGLMAIMLGIFWVRQVTKIRT